MELECGSPSRINGKDIRSISHILVRDGRRVKF